MDRATASISRRLPFYAFVMRGKCVCIDFGCFRSAHLHLHAVAKLAAVCL